MKKFAITLIALVALLVACAVTPTFAADRGQYLINVKTGPLQLGDVEYSARFAWFDMTGLSQKWFYPIYLTLGNVSGYGGFVSEWSDEAVGFGGFKYATVPGTNFLGNFSILTDNNFIFNDGETDVFSWSTIEYNFVVDNKPLYAGPQLEVIKQFGETNAWIGPHFGSPDLFEVGAYYNEKYKWSIRGSLTIVVEWQSLL